MKHDFLPEANVWNHFFRVTPLTVVTSVDMEGQVSAAPKVHFARIGDTDFVSLSGCTSGRTYRNLIATKEYVINFPGPDIAKQVAMLGGAYEQEIGVDINESGLSLLEAQQVRPPLIAECRAHLECRLVEVKHYENSALFIGQVVAASVSEEALADQGIAALGTAPLLVYVTPSHFAGMHVARKFPYPDTNG
ncbi:MAG TPA: hypothetical protein DHD79_05350 [Firmicutes bacterium]|jgi:flavin reductase (DIM6/NTAB) family NADH-FMN oxidoreductase RutF|nr:hypothetical protein [Bacillota bacterium]HAW71782.1 hypothetical protein [Bacillota bacterium]HBE05967.1 hypothetical protein [Bacillota bacterium]HBL51200.1 hypothetical protein [Bacillota bacterium]HBR24513.1 hypothetical protein [Bacillota bacterium]